MPRRAVLLYVGRISWEKNLHLLLSAYSRLSSYLTAGALLPKLVFVGDGPARMELEAICVKSGYDATFMGHRSGEELARCYASADAFAFPSFTEVSRGEYSGLREGLEMYSR
jgi:glycosyltransferase involved in cell wall biosynthesis